MNPQYLWTVHALFLIAFFVAAPSLGFAIAYAAWKGKPTSFNRTRYGVSYVVVLAAAAFLMVFAQRMQADVRTPQYFLQAACFVLGAVLFGISGGCLLGVFVFGLALKTSAAKPDKNVNWVRLLLWVLGGFSSTGFLLLLAGVAQRTPLSPLSVPLFAFPFIVVSVGAFWMMYVAFQEEKNPWPILGLALVVPFSCLWYYFERVRPRRERRSLRVS